MGSHRGGKKKKITYSRSRGKARLSLEEASSQVFLKLLLRSSKVPDHLTTSVNENSVPSITWCYPISGSSKTAQGCPSHKGHVKEKVTQGTPISLYHGPSRLVNYAVRWSNTGACFLPCLYLPSHQATAGNRAPQRKGEHCHLHNAAGKVPSLGNQFSAQSTRFTTPFMSTYANIDPICPRYQAFLKLRPAFDLKVTYF